MDGRRIIAATTPAEGAVERDAAQPALAVGQWYWVRARDDDESAEEWIGCVMEIGSNYVKVKAPSGGSARIHLGEAPALLRYEPNSTAVFQERIAHWSSESRRLLEEVKNISDRLGLRPAVTLPSPDASRSGTDLVVMSAQVDVAAYKAALIKAQKETLPELFKAIQRANEKLAEWMTADTLPLTASVESMKDAIGEIEDRIFNVSLYAGLVEDAVCCADGAPAPIDAKLHVMQRQLYMDEECLLNYTAGGMEFDDIAEFDAWLARPENRDRILPFPRTLVAMCVRRNVKDRDWDGSLLSAYINIRAAQADKFTFLYVRNGEQLWRISCEMEFGAMIFPDKAIYDPSEPKMVQMFGGSVHAIITQREYDDRYAEWERTPKKDRWPRHHFRPEDWKPFDQTNVYFDECMATISDQIKEYNRVAIIIQGLFDRSQVLHPHATVETWTPVGFNRAIQLVYDAQMVLDQGAPPDWESYRARCNASLAAGSVTVGQDIFWERAETEKEMKRRRNDYRLSEGERWRTIKRWRPHGNPGPGVLAVVQDWKPRSRVARFGWTRERWTRYGSEDVGMTLRVPASELLNVSAYTPGDYLQFFRDHRTREQYLQWAPLLLAAEDYHAGRAKPTSG